MNESMLTGMHRRRWEKSHPEYLKSSMDLLEALEALDFNEPATQARAKERVAQWRREAEWQLPEGELSRGVRWASSSAKSPYELCIFLNAFAPHLGYNPYGMGEILLWVAAGNLRHTIP